MKVAEGRSTEHRRSATQQQHDRPALTAWQPRVLSVMLLLGDLTATNVAFFLAWYFRYALELGGVVVDEFDTPYETYVPVQLGLSLVVALALYARRLYSLPKSASWLDEVSGVISSSALGVMIAFATVSMTRYPAQSRLTYIYAWFFCIVLVSCWRLVFRLFRAWLHRRDIAVERVLVVGNNQLSWLIMQSLADQADRGYRVVGFVGLEPGADFGRFKALGTLNDLPEILSAHQVSQVFIALPSVPHREVLQIIEECRRRGVQPHVVPDLYEMSLSQVDLDTINGIPLIGFKEVSIRGWNLIVKRALDVSVSAVGLLVLSPLLALIAIAIKLDSPGPVLFKQVRLGKGGIPFTVYKFRSMYDGADKQRDLLRAFNEVRGPIFKMRNDPRMTRVGRILRRTSLDELPQLWNVLRGEMSLVGPRPPIPEEVEQYEPWHFKRLAVAPGMTGIWQVSGRSRLSFDEMVVLDIFYVENWSLGLDLRILLRTIPAVISGGGAF